MASRLFPKVDWDGGFATFTPTSSVDEIAAPYAVVIVALHDGGLLLADIPDRGWCTPSGRVEPGESSLVAAHRELMEETGATAESLIPVGYFRFESPRAGIRDVPTFVCQVAECCPIPEGSESLGICVVSLSELPASYYRWDELLEVVFAYAVEQAAQKHEMK
jgi:8-oxo-dGTP diphosphatase